MPQFPRVQSQRDLAIKRQAPSPYGAAVRTDAADKYEIASEAIKKVSEMALKWQAASDTIQYTSAKANYESGLLDIEDRASQDPDYNGSEKYHKELEDLKKNSLKGFSNKMVEQKAMLEFDLGNRVSGIKIDNIFRKKALEVGQVAAFKLIDLQKSNYINAPDDKTKTAIAVNIQNIISQQVSAGIFGPKEGRELYNNSIKEAQEVIKDNEDLRKKQENEIKLAQEFAMNQREDELVKLRIDGQLTPEIIRNDLNTGTIEPKFAEVLLNSLKSVKPEKPTSLESMIKFTELVERDADIARREAILFVRAPFEDIAKFRADVMNANAQGYITDPQMAKLLEETSETFFREPVFRNALNQLALQSKLYSTPEAQARIKSEMYGSLIQKVSAGKNPREAVTEIIRETIDTEMAEINKKDEFGFETGQIINGYKYMGNNKWQK